MATRKPRPSLKPRKIPAQGRSSQTVEAILEAAARILETRGLAGYTTNAVAERAGVSIGSLYQYFPNKDALTAALIERETAPLLELAQRAREAGSFRAGVDTLIDAAVAHQMRRPELARLLDFEERRLPLGAHHAHVGEQLAGVITALLGREKRLTKAKAELIAADMFAIVRGMVDAAGERGESDVAGLAGRVHSAVHGYIAMETGIRG